MSKKLKIASVIFKLILVVILGLLFSTVFVVSNDLAIGIVSGKYFWFYCALGLLSVFLTGFFVFKKTIFIRYSILDFLAAIFSLLVILPILTGTESLNTKAILFVLLAVLYFYFRLILSLGKFQRTVLILLIIITAMVESIWGLGQLYGFSTSQHNLFLLTGSFFNPGPYAGYLAMIIPLAFYYSLSDYKVWKMRFNKRLFVFYLRWMVSTITVVSILLVLPAAMSRASWLAAIGGCSFVGIAYFAKKHKFRVYFQKYKKHIIRITVLLLLLSIAGSFAMYRFKKDSADGRMLIWKNTLTAIAENPLGVGLGNFAGTYGLVQAAYFESDKGTEQEKLVAGNPEYAFNEYLQIGLELGVAGLLVFFAIVGFALYKGLKLRYFETMGALISLLIFASMSYPFSILPFLIVMVYLFADLADSRSATLSRIPTIKSTKVLLISSIIIVAFSLHNRYPTYQAYKDWRGCKSLFSMNMYEQVSDDYKALFPYLSDKVEFLFEYGQILSKTGQYAESNQILSEGMKISCDPMFYNIMGKNYQSLSLSVDSLSASYQLYLRKAEECYQISTNIVPNRLYPYYLLTKLYAQTGDKEKTRTTARIVLQKEPKVHSPAVEEMREEVRKLLLEFED